MTADSNIDYGWDSSMGMNLYGKIKLDLKTSMRNRDNDVRDAMRLIMGEYPKLTKAITLESGKKTTRVKKPEEITDEELQDIIRTLVKSEKIILDIKKQASSDYLELLNRYLPRMARQEEIVEWIKENIDLSKFKNSMQAVGPVMKHFGKLAQGNMVKEILKEMGND